MNNTSNKSKKIETAILLNNETSSWDGAPLPNYPQGVPNITSMKLIVAPHTVLDKHYHSVLTVGYIISGELTIHSINGQTKIVRAGEAVIELMDTIHYGENKGDIPTEIIAFHFGYNKSNITTMCKDK